MSRITIFLVAMLFVCPRAGFGRALRAAPRSRKNRPAERDARMQWWRDARFGMFIHWGVYAVAGGEWKGKEVKTAGEWIMNKADIPVAEYEKLAKQFNPVKYDPAEWVRIAKDAGMKYVVITSKHHDGFALFDIEGDGLGRGGCARPTERICSSRSPTSAASRGSSSATTTRSWTGITRRRSTGRRSTTRRTSSTERKQEYIDFMKTQLKELLGSCEPGCAVVRRRMARLVDGRGRPRFVRVPAQHEAGR